MISLRIDQHELHLLPGKAVWRPASRTLYVADLHIGKASAFARGGIPLSDELLARSTASDLVRLSALIEAQRAERLVILGDLLHAPAGRDQRTMSQLAHWRASHDGVEVVLIRGNHDHAAGDPPSDAGIDCVDAPSDAAGLRLVHHPLEPTDGVPTLAGHVHPFVRLASIGDAARCACFWLSDNQLVLPAFGGFTGGFSVSPRQGDRVFVAAPERVLEIPVVTAATRGSGRPR
ncbi:MAG: ligase-associated DNA damage response endonuclease PdeM [Phycisphaerales bacterium]